MPRFLVIHNPVSGRRRSACLRQVLAALDEAGAEVELRRTAGPGDAEVLARNASGGGFDAIVVAGGDGTINEAANGLDAGAPPLALVPLGTANVFAAEIGWPRAPRGVARAILGGTPRSIYAGRADGRRFLIMAGAGLDGEVVASVGPGLKRRLGKGAYVLETLRRMVRYRYPALDITADGVRLSAVTAVACKGRHYGGPHLFAPGADPARPEFELVLFDRAGALWTLVYAAALVCGLLPRMAGVRRVTARAIDIAAPIPVSVQLDGDAAGALPVAITIDPVPLRVLYPPDA